MSNSEEGLVKAYQTPQSRSLMTATLTGGKWVQFLLSWLQFPNVLHIITKVWTLIALSWSPALLSIKCDEGKLKKLRLWPRIKFCPNPGGLWVCFDNIVYKALQTSVPCPELGVGLLRHSVIRAEPVKVRRYNSKCSAADAFWALNRRCLFSVCLACAHSPARQSVLTCHPFSFRATLGAINVQEKRAFYSRFPNL